VNEIVSAFPTLRRTHVDLGVLLYVTGGICSICVLYACRCLSTHVIIHVLFACSIVLRTRLRISLPPCCPQPAYPLSCTQNSVTRICNTPGAYCAMPTLVIKCSPLLPSRYEGVQLQNTRFFKWPAGAPYRGSDSARNSSLFRRSKTDDDGTAMPLVLTAADGVTLVASPLDEFFVACQTDSLWIGNFSFGLQATLNSVPAGHVHATLFVADTGVRAATAKWGDVLLSTAGSGKKRSMQWTMAGDVGLRSLSYYTDNGGERCAVFC